MTGHLSVYQNSLSLIVASGVTVGGVLGESPLLTLIGIAGGAAVIYANIAKGKRDLAERDLLEAQMEKLND